MYESHFNLRRTPFGMALKPDQLFRSAARERARRRILHLLELRGIGLAAGEAGVGKTTLCRQVADELHDGLCRVSCVSMPTGSAIDTLNAVAASFGLAGGVSRAGVFGAIKAEVARMVQETRPAPVLIFDEAAISATTSSPSSSSRPTTPWIPRTGCACCWSGRPACACGSGCRRTSRWRSGSSSTAIRPASARTRSGRSRSTGCSRPAPAIRSSSRRRSRRCGWPAAGFPG